MGGAETIILSAGGAESMMLSACAESMIFSALPAVSMIPSLPFDCVVTLLSCYQLRFHARERQRNNVCEKVKRGKNEGLR